MKKIAVLFGGLSTEHEVSICSGTSIIENIDKKKYKVYPIYMDKDGQYFKYLKNVEEIKKIPVGEYPKELEIIDNILNYLKEMDIIFPVFHGLYGEDGTFQGMLELIKKRYVGCKVLSSAVCMDKIYTKILFKQAKIKSAKYIYIKSINGKYYYVNKSFKQKKVDFEQIDQMIQKELKYPVFIKPSNSGSSIGVGKASTFEELKERLESASKYDKKILIEEAIVGKEVECAILGKDNKLIASTVGEILPAEEFYSFDAKYKNSASKVLIPANIDQMTMKKIQNIAKKAFSLTDGSGLSRVDFFVTTENEIYINEINTMPGFTNISMYPKLFEYDGIDYKKLINKLIELS